MHSSLRVLYGVPWLGAVVCLIWLCLFRIPLHGVRSFTVFLDGRSPWVNAFLPGQRATPMGPQPQGWVGQRITDEPVYSTLRLPGIYQSLNLGLEFRPDTQPLLELGLAQEPVTDVELQPLWSQALSSGWRRATWQRRQGYVREGDPDSALADSDMNRLLVWHASSTVPAYMDVTPQAHSFATALRGSYDLSLVPVQGRITFDIQLQDMNRRRQSGAVVFTLSNNGVLLSSEALSLAGSRDHQPSKPYLKTLVFDHLEAGVYKLSVVADDDIFTRQLSSSLRHWVIGPRLYFGDQVGFATSTLPGFAWTNAQHLQIETFHPEGLQAVSLGSASAVVAQVHTEYGLDRLASEQSAPAMIRAPQGDLRVIGDGYFALAPELLFLPAPRRLTDASRPLEEGVHAILTPYIAPVALEDGWYLSSSAYAIQPRPGTLRLTLSAPGILSRGAATDVRSMRLTYRRLALSWHDWLQVVWRELASAWHAL